jgi:pilus assembly protein Flp/PilA
MSKFTAFLTDESGAAAAEYVLILAIIGSGIAGAAVLFGEAISSALDGAADLLGTETGF